MRGDCGNIVERLSFPGRVCVSAWKAMGLYVYAIIVSCATRLYQGVRVNAVSSNSAELRGSATAIAWLPSSNTIPTDLCIAIAAACERKKEREKGKERERTSASRKSEKGTKAVAMD